MAEEGLDPWCDEHWDRIRENEEYNSITGAVRVVEITLDNDAFQEEVTGEYDGNVQAAMEDFSPLCCWLEERDALEAVYEDVRMDEPTDVAIDKTHEQR